MDSSFVAMTDIGYVINLESPMHGADILHKCKRVGNITDFNNLVPRTETVVIGVRLLSESSP